MTEENIYNAIPSHMREAITRYVERGELYGHFLTALFSNDLHGVFARADTTSRALLHTYVKLIYNRIPGNAWGSPEKVKEYMEERSADPESWSPPWDN